jgi:TolA-binding protein
MKKIIILFIIFMLIVIYNDKIIEKVETYTDQHRDADWAPRVEYYIGNYYYYLTKYDKALEVYEWILYVYKKSDVADKAQYRIARCYESQGNNTKAIAAYKKFLATYPKSELVNKAKQTLELLELRI